MEIAPSVLCGRAVGIDELMEMALHLDDNNKTGYNNMLAILSNENVKVNLHENLTIKKVAEALLGSMHAPIESSRLTAKVAGVSLYGYVRC